MHGNSNIKLEVNMFRIVQDKELQTYNTKRSDINSIDHIPLYSKTEKNFRKRHPRCVCKTDKQERNSL